MQPGDFDDFCAVLDGACRLLSRGAYQPDAASSALFFRAMQAYPLAVVRKALEAHIADPQRGRFVPVPADLIAQIEGAAARDGRPEADEAWAIALLAADEANTVVWTAEISQAWASCRTVLDVGDRVGARMAFKAAYQRLLDGARTAREPAMWSASLGFDAKLRDGAIAAAVEDGRLPVSMLPAPTGTVAGLLELTKHHSCPPGVVVQLDAIRAQIKARGDAPGADFIAKQRTADAKAKAAADVQAYIDRQAPHG